MVDLDKLMDLYYAGLSEAMHSGKTQAVSERLALLAVYDYGWSSGYWRRFDLELE